MRQAPLTRYPIDDETYELLVVISSKLEAMHVYDRLDDGSMGDASLRERLRADDTQHVDLLVDALRQRIGTTSGAAGTRTATPPETTHRPADEPARSPAGADWLADRR